MGWACGAYGWGEGVYRVLVGKPEGRRPLGRPRRRWVDNIRMDLQEVGCGYMDWIGLAQDRDRWWTLVSAVMNLRVPWNAGNFLTSYKPVSCSRRTLHHGVSKWRRWQTRPLPFNLPRSDSMTTSSQSTKCILCLDYELKLTLTIFSYSFPRINPFNAELNPICQLLALLEAHHILHVSRIRVKWQFLIQ